MFLETSRFGEIELEEEHIYSFAKGIPGFEEFRRYILLDMNNTPFSHLQSVENGDLALVVVDPFSFYANYEFILPDTVMQELDIEKSKQVAIRCVVTVKRRLETATVNLLAPLVFNVEKRKGKQIILHQSAYTTKHPLLPPASLTSEARKEG